MAPRPINRKIIEKYFDFADEIATCKICSQKLKSYRIFNLKTHIIKVHKINEDEFKNIDTSNHLLKLAINADKKYRKDIVKIKITKKELLRSYIGLVTEDSIPFNILNSQNFRNIVDPICRGLSERTGEKFSLNADNCQKILQLASNDIRNEIKSDLRQRLLSLKIDSVPSSLRNVFGVSAQFIRNSEVQYHILGVLEMQNEVGSSSPKCLESEILNTLSKYNVNLSQIVSITVDNGPIMKTTNLTNSLMFEGCQETLEADGGGNDMFLRTIKMLEDTPYKNLGELQIQRCSSHIVQLCALDTWKNDEIYYFLLTCRNLVKYVRKPSNGYGEIFEMENFTLPVLDCSTKWGSTYTMLESLKNAKEILIEIEPKESELPGKNMDLSETWYFIEAYCIAFEPLQSVIKKFQTEQLHYGNFYAEWLKCKLCTQKIRDRGERIYVKKIARILLSSMEARTRTLLTKEHILACLYLDPRFNHTLTSAQRFQATTYLKQLHVRISSLSDIVYEEKNIDSSSETSSVQLDSMDISQNGDEYLNKYLSRSFVPSRDGETDVMVQIENLQLPFLRVETNILQFWRDKQYSDPELYALSNICFAIPATQVSIGPVFSSLKLMLADSSNAINQDTLENILLVKLNASYLDHAIEAMPALEDAA